MGLMNDEYPDKYYSELNEDERNDIVGREEGMRESNEMLRITSVIYAASWLFANDHITMKEYMDIIDDAEEQFDSPLP